MNEKLDLILEKLKNWNYLYNKINILYKYLIHTQFNYMKMQMKIFVLFLIILNLVIIAHADNLRNLRLRNALLRIYIASDKKQILKDYYKKSLNKTKTIVLRKKESIFSKIYEINMIYNNLTDEEKELLEFIISLCY